MNQLFAVPPDSSFRFVGSGDSSQIQHQRSPPWWFQAVRPSFHSAALFLSHVGFAAAIRIACRRRLWSEALFMTLCVVISLLYHVCDENLNDVCVFGWSIVRWHLMDVWATFTLISVVLGVFVLDLSSFTARVALRLAYLLWVTVQVCWIGPASTLGLGSILATVFGSVAFRYLRQRHHLLHHDDESQHQRGIAATTAPIRFRVDRLAKGVALFTVALCCFMVANAPLTEAVKTYDREAHEAAVVSVNSASLLALAGRKRLSARGNSNALQDDAADKIALNSARAQLLSSTIKPMDIPDTAVYWAVHSIWHVASAWSACFVLRMKERVAPRRGGR